MKNKNTDKLMDPAILGRGDGAEKTGSILSQGSALEPVIQMKRYPDVMSRGKRYRHRRIIMYIFSAKSLSIFPSGLQIKNKKGRQSLKLISLPADIPSRPRSKNENY